jgi:hypothetical protein
MRRTNFAPTAATIAVALVLIALGLVGSTGRFVPAAWGVVAYVMAEALLIVGCATRRL